MNNRDSHYAAASDGHVLEEELFFLRQEPAEAELTAPFGGWERCAPDFEIRRQQYPFYVLEFPLRGRCDLQINGEHYRLEPGCLAGFAPQDAHHYRCDPTDPMEHLFICYTGSDAARLFQHSQLAQSPLLKPGNIQQVALLVRSIVDKGSHSSLHSEMLCNQYLRLLLLELADQDTDTGKTHDAEGLYQQCRLFMEDNYSWLAYPHEVADTFKITPRHLSRLFKQHGSSSPQDYLLRLKMHKASVLLLASQASVQSIAQMVGYEDPYHFSRNFKKVYQISPRHWRQREISKI